MFIFIFPYCPKLKDIHYEGSSTEWWQINKDEYWDASIRGKHTIHYNSTM